MKFTVQSCGNASKIGGDIILRWKMFPAQLQENKQVTRTQRKKKKTTATMNNKKK